MSRKRISDKEEIARDILSTVNEGFHKRETLSLSFYKQLMQAGFAYSRCILVKMIPAGPDTYTGQIIRQDGRVFEFDIDLDIAENSSFVDITDEFHRTRKRFANSKRRKNEVTAYRL